QAWRAHVDRRYKPPFRARRSHTRRRPLHPCRPRPAGATPRPCPPLPSPRPRTRLRAPLRGRSAPRGVPGRRAPTSRAERRETSRARRPVGGARLPRAARSGARLRAPRARPAHLVAGRDARPLPRHRRAPRRRTGRRAPGDPRGQRRTALPPAPRRPGARVEAGSPPGRARPPLPPSAAPQGVTVRLDELLRDLEGDRVIAARLAHRHYRVPLKRARAEGLAVRTLQVPLTAGSRVARRVSVLLWPEERRLMRVKPPVIRHLAGVTACRLFLGAPIEFWRNDAGRPLGLLQPDGLWWQPHAGPDVAKAIEYDAGSYTR